MFEQLVAPDELYLPPPQALQDVAFEFADLYVPAEHDEHVEPLRYVPALHTHADVLVEPVAPLVLVFARHDVQALCEVAPVELT